MRVSVQRTAGAVGLQDAAEVLRSMLDALGTAHAFLPDDQAATFDWPMWCRTAGRSTEAHLVALAARHGMLLATLDESIPGAFVVP